MNREMFFGGDRAHVIDRLAQHIEHAAERLLAHGNGDGLAEIVGFHAANQTVGRLHGDGAHTAFADVLRHFGGDIDLSRNVVAFAGYANGVVDLGNVTFGKLDFDGGSGDLDYAAFNQSICRHKETPVNLYSAAAPLTISIISRVMLACRTRFKFKVRVWITSPALELAASMAAMRAA